MEQRAVLRAESYHDDEDRDYLLRRLHTMASRFADLFEAEEFARFFPQMRQTDPMQLNLF